MLIDLPSKAKPSKVVSKDKTRPHLCNAYVEERDGETVLIATDSYKLLILPVSAEATTATFISLDALKAIEKSGRGEVGEFLEPLDKLGNANGVLFRKPEGDRPKWADLEWPDEPEPKDRLTIGLNAELLLELAQGMAATHHGVKLTIDLSKVNRTKDGKFYEKPYVVEPVGSGHGRGMLMPIRVRSY